MLKLLVKKQLMEVFKGYFYDFKKNKKRSKAGVIGWFIFFAVIMIGVLGGMFAGMSSMLCSGIVSAGMDWLYFVIMGLMSAFLGLFGSVFNTYAGLYRAQDNDLLLSMPIPVKYIIASRLLNVYILDVMYSAVVIIPAIIVYWITAPVTAVKVIGGIALMLIISFIVMVLCCALGWFVAKASGKLKNKSLVTVLLSLAGIALYYLLYFKAMDLINDLVANAAAYGEQIKGAAYGLYLFGRIGQGDMEAAGIFAVVSVALLVVTIRILVRGFIGIATASDNVSKHEYREKAVAQKSQFAAVLGKEFKRFTSSATYMLNSGLGLLMIPIAGVLILIKGNEFFSALENVLADHPGSGAIILCGAMLVASSMNMMAASAVSLEGKNLWIVRSLPIDSKLILRAKYCVQLILTSLPMLFCSICAAIIIPESLITKLLFVAASVLCTVFAAVGELVINIKLPNLTWTNEMAVIKQSGAVAITLFGGFVYAAIIVVLYLFVAWPIGLTLYLAIISAVQIVFTVLLMRWVDTKGVKAFEAL